MEETAAPRLGGGDDADASAESEKASPVSRQDDRGRIGRGGVCAADSVVSSNLSVDIKKATIFQRVKFMVLETQTLAVDFSVGRASLLRQQGTGPQLTLREPCHFDYIKPFEKA